MSDLIRHLLDDANMDDEDIMRIMSMVEKLEEENEELAEKIEMFEYENGGLRNEVDCGDEIIGDKNEEIEKLKEENENLQGEKEYWEKEHHKLTLKVEWGTIEEYSARIDELVDKNNQQYKENEELKERVSEWKEVMGEYAGHDDPWPSLVGEWICDQTNEFEEDIEKLKEENEKLKEKLNSIQGEIKDVLKEEEKKTNTKNVKGNRMIVATTYHSLTAVFKIPDGVDLEDKSVVEYWGTKYGTLRIKYVGKEKEEEIEWEYEPELDWKYGTDEIIDADEWGVEYTDDEEEKLCEKDDY